MQRVSNECIFYIKVFYKSHFFPPHASARISMHAQNFDNFRSQSRASGKFSSPEVCELSGGAVTFEKYFQKYFPHTVGEIFFTQMQE